MGLNKNRNVISLRNSQMALGQLDPVCQSYFISLSPLPSPSPLPIPTQHSYPMPFPRSVLQTNSLRRRKLWLLAAPGLSLP